MQPTIATHPQDKAYPLPKGLELIIQERLRQIHNEGWTASHDDQHDQGEIAVAAACYAVFGLPSDIRVIDADIELEVGPRNLVVGLNDAWPWEEGWDKRSQHDRRRRLEIAGALIAAELDRLLRESGQPNVEPVTIDPPPQEPPPQEPHPQEPPPQEPHPQTQPFTLDDLMMFVAMIDSQNVEHRRHGYKLGLMKISDMATHLYDEVQEVEDAPNDDERRIEVADCLGIVLHMATHLGMNPLTLAETTRRKLVKRFKIPGVSDDIAVGNISPCPRCGGEHKVVTFEPIENPCDDYDYFASCPKNGQPILMRRPPPGPDRMTHKELLQEAVRFAETVDELQTRNVQLVEERKAIDENVEFIVMSLGDYAVRVCEGGGPEDLQASLAVSVAKLQQAHKAALEKVAALEAAIAQHNLCHDLHGKVGRAEFEEGCRREVARMFGECGWSKHLRKLIQLAGAVVNECDLRPKHDGDTMVLLNLSLDFIKDMRTAVALAKANVTPAIAEADADEMFPREIEIRKTLLAMEPKERTPAHVDIHDLLMLMDDLRFEAQVWRKRFEQYGNPGGVKKA